MGKKKIYKPEQLVIFNEKLDTLYEQLRQLQGAFYIYFEYATKEPLERGDFERCFEILDTWDARNTEIHKFQLFNIIAKKEAEVTKEEPRSYHERYKKD